MDLKALVQTVNQIAEEKGIESGKVFEAIEDALAAAYRKESGQRGLVVRAKLDPKTGEAEFSQVKEVVDENSVRFIDEETEVEDAEQGRSAEGTEPSRSVEDTPSSETEEEKLPRYNADRHLLIEEAKKIKADAKVGDELTFSLTQENDFGRIAAQTAKQVILQRLREAERDSIMTEFKDKEGTVVSGIVQRFERGNVYIDLGRTNGIMFANESIPGEHYRIGERLRFYVLAVQSETKIPGIILSRAHPRFVAKLFEMEIPEMAENIVEIKAIARESGSRTKVAVHSNLPEIDPVGSCVGQRGTRIMAISNELGQEKLDVVPWSEKPEEFIANSLSPAKIRQVEITDNREARVLVADDQLSLAIGRGGQNVRLAAKLTGWKIDVRSEVRPEEKLEEGVAEVEDGERSRTVEDAEGTRSTQAVEAEEKPVYHKREPEDDE
ncbi:MAG: transcription termination/antitermination protein NusA [Candidatus Colwellbacteria bacterium]|nr:transcription termination/antitermination protein NusA [Candidatus Colwellbacteria bacterium]